ncbi:MAG: InlB B-repeat-containing protein [Tissierellia bacterium]|nr:InlB B-repeat-containing protein [Tissierellia bacterium]
MKKSFFKTVLIMAVICAMLPWNVFAQGTEDMEIQGDSVRGELVCVIFPKEGQVISLYKGTPKESTTPGLEFSWDGVDRLLCKNLDIDKIKIDPNGGTIHVEMHGENILNEAGSTIQNGTVDFTMKEGASINVKKSALEVHNATVKGLRYRGRLTIWEEGATTLENCDLNLTVLDAQYSVTLKNCKTIAEHQVIIRGKNTQFDGGTLTVGASMIGPVEINGIYTIDFNNIALDIKQGMNFTPHSKAGNVDYVIQFRNNTYGTIAFTSDLALRINYLYGGQSKLIFDHCGELKFEGILFGASEKGEPIKPDLDIQLLGVKAWADEAKTEEATIMQPGSMTIYSDDKFGSFMDGDYIANPVVIAPDGSTPTPTEHRVTFDANGGTPVPAEQTVADGKSATKPSERPSKDGFVFDFWSLDGENPYDFMTPLTEDITLKAIYYRVFQVTFDADGGSPIPETQTVKSGEKATKPTDPFKAGYVFKHWAEKSDPMKTPYDFETRVVTLDTDLIAIYNKEHTVTFETHGGTSVPSQKVEDGELAVEPTVPTIEHGTFDSWVYAVDSPKYWLFDRDTVNQDMTLYAIYTPDAGYHTVTFYAFDGEPKLQQQIVQAGTQATRPTDPTKEDEDFLGWYLEDATDPFDFGTKIEGDTVFLQNSRPQRQRLTR